MVVDAGNNRVVGWRSLHPLPLPIKADTVEQMGISHSAVVGSISWVDVGPSALLSSPQDCTDLQSYNYILQFGLQELSKFDLLV